MLVKSALGRSLVALRHRSAYEATPPRLARYLTLSAGQPTLTRTSPLSLLSFPVPGKRHSNVASSIHHISQIQRAYFATTQHFPAATMVTKSISDPARAEIRTPRDPNTLSNYHNFVTRHTSVDFDIDFERKRLFGSVVLKLECLTDEDVKEVVLDTRYVWNMRGVY
jgi:hypothetical protein